MAFAICQLTYYYDFNSNDTQINFDKVPITIHKA